MRVVRLLFLLSVLALPVRGEAQGVGSVMSGMRNGGGWLTIPIVAGKGSFSTTRLPTAGLTLKGCVNVWPGHSGTWDIDARENVTQGHLHVSATPGIGQRFSHEFGMQAQIDFDFRWSEPRDTTLMLWVGVDMGSDTIDACEPKYGSQE
jgi:hypothetical protein